ncbi:hypothetical protein AWB65_06309 [Caballeronia humi]|uniref:Uncharacterized protein n=1 Tax=Caballeronia humi TaxID=326474 RepID=A0A158JBZ1_9BURK|nr:hypothetical protein AWB65_06309 [Caballeronia humi]
MLQTGQRRRGGFHHECSKPFFDIDDTMHRRACQLLIVKRKDCLNNGRLVVGESPVAVISAREHVVESRLGI